MFISYGSPYFAHQHDQHTEFDDPIRCNYGEINDKTSVENALFLVYSHDSRNSKICARSAQHFGNCCPLAYSFGHGFLCMIVKRKYLHRYLRVAQENLTFETSELKM